MKKMTLAEFVEIAELDEKIKEAVEDQRWAVASALSMKQVSAINELDVETHDIDVQLIVASAQVYATLGMSQAIWNLGMRSN